MNLTRLLQFESQHYYGVYTQSQAVNSFVANSLRYLIEHFFQQVAPSFIIILSCRRPNPFNFYKNIMQQFFYSVDNMIVQLVHFNHTQPQRIEGPRLHNLLLVDSLQAFLDIDVISYSRLYDTNEYYYIFLQQRDHLIPQEMQAIFQYCWSNHLINCNVQIQTAEGEVFMYTYFPYTAESCDRVVPVKINQFIGDSWQHDNFFPAKLRNFYGCPLAVGVRIVTPFLTVSRRTNSSGYEVQGSEGCLLNQLARYLNFTMNVVISKIDERTGNLCCGAIAMLANRSVLLGGGYYRKRVDMLTTSSTTFPHHQNTLVASTLVNAHNLTTYEIFVYPFQLYTWLAIVGSFVLTTFGADLVYRNNSAGGVRRRILSSCNLLAASLGMSLRTEPRQLPNRVLFICWLWTTFLIRSMYSALLYYLFRDNVHQQLPQTLWDLYLQDYKSIFNRYTQYEMQEVPYFVRFRNMRSLIFNSTNDFIALHYLEQHMDDRVIAITSRDFLIHYVGQHRKPGMFRILPENVMHQQLTMYLTKHSFLINQLDQTLMHLHSVGLSNYCTRLGFNDRYFKSTHLFGQKLIEQRDLHSIYIVYGCLHGLAMGVFILELLSKRCRLLRRILQ